MGIQVRAIDASVFLTDDDDLSAVSFAGKIITKTQAMRLIAVFACTGIIADAVAEMPIDVIEKRDDDTRVPVEPPLWLDPNFWPNPEYDLFGFVFRFVVSVLLGGTSFGVITARDRLGFATEVWNLAPPARATRTSGRLQYVWPDGSTLEPHTPRNPEGDLIVVKGYDAGGDFGLDPIMNVAKQAIGLGLATEEYGARFFGQGQQPSGVIEAQGNMDEGRLKLMADTWDRAQSGLGKAHKPAVLANARWRQTSIAPDSAQFIETRRFQINEIARLYRVPPHLIMDVDRSTSWGTGIEEQNVAFVKWTLQPWLTRLEQRFSVLLPRGQVVKFNTAALERGSLSSRYTSYGQARQGGWLSVNDIRRIEDLAPIPEGDLYLSPLSMVSADSPAAVEGPTAEPTSVDEE